MYRCAGLGIDDMADEVKKFWFVAGVFREPHDLLSPIVQLRESGISGHGLLVVANHRAEDARKTLAGPEDCRVPVVAALAGGNLTAPPAAKLSLALRTMLEVMSGAGARGAQRSDSQSPIYAQLRQDVASGAIILIASVVDPDEQLTGARILLRGNCECVLTHEIAA